MGRKVLIIEDDQDTLTALSIRVKALHCQVLTARDGYSAVQMAQQEKPALILLDLTLPGGDGMSVLSRLQALSGLASTPVAVVSARDSAVWMPKALQAGAVAFLSKPVDTTLLARILNQHLSPEQATVSVIPGARKVLIIEDDSGTRLAMGSGLKSAGFEVANAADSITAMTVILKEKPDLILLDLGLPGGDGITLLERVKSNMKIASIPVIVLTAKDPAVHRDRALQAGACAFFEKPVDNRELISAVNVALE